MKHYGFAMIDALLAGVLVASVGLLTLQAKSSGDGLRGIDRTIVNKLAVEKAYSSALYQYGADLQVATSLTQTSQWGQSVGQFCDFLVTESQAVKNKYSGQTTPTVDPSPFEVWFLTHSQMGFAYLNKCTKTIDAARDSIQLEIEMCWNDMTGKANSGRCGHGDDDSEGGSTGLASDKFYVYVTRG